METIRIPLADSHGRALIELDYYKARPSGQRALLSVHDSDEDTAVWLSAEEVRSLVAGLRKLSNEIL
jgi:hypothetical protein